MADAQRTERFQQLEERVNQRVREAVSSLQGELRERLRRAGDQVVEQLERELEDSGAELPGSFLSSEELSPLTEEAAAEASREGRRRGLAELAAALSALDHGGSQAAILSSLVEEAGRFAGRSALFLARPHGLELWSAHGWGVSLEGTVVEYAEGGPWSREALGRGTSALASGETGRLCSHVDAPLPTAGLLVPMVLRDRLAAVLYADHGEGEELLPEALQGLTYAAALALETLPFRDRAATPTLVGPDAGDEEGEALGVWSSEAEAAPEREPEPEPLPEGASFGIAAREDEGGEDAFAAPTAAAGAGFRLSSDDEERTTPPPAPSFDTDLDTDLDSEPEEIGLEEGGQGGELEGGELDLGDVELEDETSGDLYEGTEAGSEDLEDASAGGWALEDSSAGAGPAAEVGELQVSEPEPPVDSPDLENPDLDSPDLDSPDLDSADLDSADLDSPDLDSGAYDAPAFDSPGLDEPELEIEDDEELPAPSFDDGFDDEPTASEESTPWSSAPAAPEATPDDEIDRDATADLAPPPAPTAEPPSAAPPPPPAESGGGSAGGSQVAPPSDLEGPGRAFAGTSAPASEADARHEEARRLARLLVSEIRLYNEEEVDEGRRNNDIYERLKEDIDRSRQMYEERVDPSIREETDYFYQELVRNLGGGDAKTLGI